MAKGKRAIMRIDLSPSAKQQFMEVADRNGMTQLAVSSRLVEWFHRQPEAVQQAVLKSMFEGDQAAITKLVLSRISA